MLVVEFTLFIKISSVTLAEFIHFYISQNNIELIIAILQNFKLFANF